MAEIIYQHPVQEIKGALAKHGIINRRKLYRDDRGKVIHEGKPEAYAVRHPRNFDKTPPQGNELKHHNRFKQACEQAYIELHDEAKRTEWQKRFNAQLKRSTPDTPIDSKTGKRKRCSRFDAFVRAVIYAEIKEQDIKAQDHQYSTD